MLISFVLVCSVLSSTFGIPNSEFGSSSPAKRSQNFHASANVVGEKFGIQAHFDFFGKKGKLTWIKVRVLKGLTNNPALGGPFPYHIHTNPIPPDGNCTKAHPLNVTEGLVCDPAFPQYCQTGDLSGKHGKINGTSSGSIPIFMYSDAFVRFYPQSHSLLGRSIVIHSANKTRLACGNITSHLDGTADRWGNPTYQPSNYVKDYPATAPVPPGPPVIPFNGTTMTDPAVLAALPYPLPVPALSLNKAPNVKLDSITHVVKFNNTEQTITQPKETKSNENPPF